MYIYSSSIGLYLDRSLIARARQHIGKLESSLSHATILRPRSHRRRLLRRGRRGGCHVSIALLGSIVIVQTDGNRKVHARRPVVDDKDAAPVRRNVVPHRLRAADPRPVARAAGHRQEGVGIRHPAQLAQPEPGGDVLEAVGTDRDLDAPRPMPAAAAAGSTAAG